MPRRAISNLAALRAMALVKTPRSYPINALSTGASGKAAQLTAMKTRQEPGSYARG